MAEATQQLRIVITAQDQASQVMRNLGQQANSLVANMAKGAAAGVGFAAFNQVANAIGDTFRLATDAVIGFNSTLEQSRIAWTTMLGGASQANAMLAQLQAFAQATPFSFPDVERAARRFTAMGIAAGDVLPLMRAVAEGAIAVGGGADAIQRISTALGQMSTRTKVTAEDMMQLTEVGVPAWRILAQATGQSVAQIQDSVSKGQVSADVMIKAFERFAELNWAQLLDTQTFATAMSNIQDAATQLIAGAFRPLFDGLRDLAIRFQDFLQSQDARNFAQIILNAQLAVALFVQTIANSAPTLTLFAGLLGGIATLLGVQMVAAATRAAIALAIVNAPLLALIAVAAVTGVVVAANWEDMANAADRFSAFASEKWGGLVDWFTNTFVPAIGNAAVAAWENFANPAIQAFNAVSQAWQTFWNSQIGQTASSAFQQLQNLAAQGWQGFVDIATKALGLVIQGWNNFVSLLADLKNAGVALPPFFDLIAGKVVDVDRLAQGLGAVGGAVRQVQGIALAGNQAIQAFVAWIPTAVQKTIQVIQAAGGDLSTLPQRIAELLRQGATAINQQFGDLGKGAGTAFGTGVVAAAKPLLEELARLIAQQGAEPATEALADVRAQIRRAELVIADLTQPIEARMAAFRQKFQLETFTLPPLELEQFDVSEPVRKLTEAEQRSRNALRIAEIQQTLAGGISGATAVATGTGTGPTAVAPTAVAPAAAAPTRVELHIVVEEPSGGSLAVYDELIEANGQAQTPPVIKISAMRRH